jgi:hypothetical protein
MELTLDQIRAAMQLLALDVARAADGPWALDVDDDAVLRARIGDHTETEVIDRELDEEDYVLADALIARDETALEEVIRQYASETVWIALSDILRSRSLDWPRCAAHPAQRLDVCLGTWYCEGPGSHNVARFGELPMAAVL